ncbi:hypothetical protein ATJ97_0670 [Georgenia soli]|uniref:Uncharacterized protein n=1 Tax=Georgenia soli TaxID=638953 RepID=A0A2A9EH22_9MICO|nr:hypothetical protein [Georgenia soli]PFG38198.1 hypothetical protein ATJ97_0670 [Georgenia soli]
MTWWPWARTEKERAHDELFARVTLLVQRDHKRQLPAERAERAARPTRTWGGSYDPYPYVMRSLREFAPLTLRMLEQAAPRLSEPAGPGIYRFLRVQLRRRVWAREMATPEANVLDGLVLHELAPELVNNWRVRRRLRRALELDESGSLYEGALEPYGRAPLTTVLSTAVALDEVLRLRAMRDMPDGFGYSNMDAWGDLMDGVVPMTPGLVKVIHEVQPSPEELVAMSRNGRLAELGLHPADLDDRLDRLHQRLLSELRQRFPEA